MQMFRSNDGTAIACEKTGSGPPLVLLHGTTADHTRWAPVLPALSERFTVYACDRRGRGASDDGDPYAIEREFEDVAAVVDGIGGPVDLLGHSHGALCALEGATRTRNLRRLVLYEPPIPDGEPIVPEDLVERLDALLAAGDKDGALCTFLTEGPRVPPKELALMRSRPVWRVRVEGAGTIPREVRAVNRYRFVPERFQNLKVPILLLLGGESPSFFRIAMERVQSAVPNARLDVLPGQQHVAIDTAPDLFSRTVIDFLQEDVVGEQATH